MERAVSTSAQAAPQGAASRLGIAAGQVIQEFGYDTDVDDDLRFAIEDITTTDLEDEEYADVADAVLLWWRADDGDLVDAVVDGLTNLVEGGFIVVLTPKAGRSGHVDASDIEEAATTAGLHTSGSVNACEDWTATRLVAPKTARR
jgi:6-phosphogluconate dehydrogenase (decarboxylating)